MKKRLLDVEKYLEDVTEKNDSMELLSGRPATLYGTLNSKRFKDYWVNVEVQYKIKEEN